VATDAAEALPSTTIPSSPLSFARLRRGHLVSGAEEFHPRALSAGDPESGVIAPQGDAPHACAEPSRTPRAKE
jgi:hypothetical protein